MTNKQIQIHFDWILAVIFIILKLNGILKWKWIWVFSPLWIGWIICLVSLAVIYIADKKPKSKPNLALGNRLVWDEKTNTMYCDCEKEL